MGIGVPMRASNLHVIGPPLRWVRKGWDRLRTGYRLIPLTCVALAVGPARAMIGFDRYMHGGRAGRVAAVAARAGTGGV